MIDRGGFDRIDANLQKEVYLTAIEPIIGHLKSDFRLSRNLLKGQVGDEINVLMVACAWNFRKWLVIATIFLFWQKLGLFFVKYLRFFVVLDKKQFC